MFNEREPFLKLARATRACRGTRRGAAEAHFVEHDEDSSSDHILIDPLDDRESRCAVGVSPR